MAFLAPIMPFLSIASGVVGAIGTLSQAGAASATAQSQAQAAQYNATIERQRADAALQQADAQEEQSRRNSRKVIGAQRAALVENGIGLDSGTGSDLVQDSTLNAEMDALNIRYQGQLNARGFNAQAALDDYSSEAAKSRADSALTAGFFGAASSVLTGAGDYYKYKTLPRVSTATGYGYGG